MLSLKVSDAPQDIKIACDFVDYRAGVFNPEGLTAYGCSENARAQAGVLHVVRHALLDEV